MSLSHYLLVASLLAGVVLIAGCTSNSVQPPGTTTPLTVIPTTNLSFTGQENFTILLSDKILQQSDMPAGFDIFWRGELLRLRPGEDPLGYLGGYDINANRSLTADKEEKIVHTIVIYNTTAQPIGLVHAFTALYPQLTNSSLSIFDVSGLGDEGIGYQWSMPRGSIPEDPGMSLSGVLILFKKDGIIETVHVMGVNTTANKTLALELAHKAAAKLA